jgi:hypothetical protein
MPCSTLPLHHPIKMVRDNEAARLAFLIAPAAF